jgi:hypothetical protein
MDRRTFCRSAIAFPGLSIGKFIFAQTHDHAAMSAEDGEFNPFVVSNNDGWFFPGVC